MKTVKLVIFFAILTTFAAGCKKGIDEPDKRLFEVKAGTITYQYTFDVDGDHTTDMCTMIFDDYGNLARIGDVIIDRISQKTYHLYPDEKQYREFPLDSDLAQLWDKFYLGNDQRVWERKYPNMIISDFKKASDMTVAGKDCSVTLVDYKWEGTDDKCTMFWGGWRKITFWIYETIEGIEGSRGFRKLEAIDFTKTIPSDCFSVPSDYTKKSNIKKIVQVQTEDGRTIEVEDFME